MNQNVDSGTCGCHFDWYLLAAEARLGVPGDDGAEYCNMTDKAEHGRLTVQVNQEATEQINRTKKPGATVTSGEKGHDG